MSTITPVIGRAAYFALLEPFFAKHHLEAIRYAYLLSKYGHRGQKRKATGERYFNHPKAVSLILFEELEVRDHRILVEALLHDICEDSFLMTEYRIRRNFGKKVAWDVRLLTKDNKEIYYARLRTCGRWRPILVKLCDRIHNMRSMEGMPAEFLAKQVAETRAHFFHLCDILRGSIPTRYAHVVATCEKELEALCTRHTQP